MCSGLQYSESVMATARQLTIEACGPDTHAEIDAKAELVRAARRRHKAELDKLRCTWGAEVAQAEKDLYEAMLVAGVARYEYSYEGARYRLDLSCPEPTVKLTFVGNEE